MILYNSEIMVYVCVVVDLSNIWDMLSYLLLLSVVPGVVVRVVPV